MKEIAAKKFANKHESRDLWLRAAAVELRKIFALHGYEVPENMRFSIGFPSCGKKGNRRAEIWHETTSEGKTFEVFIKPDVEDEVDALGRLTKQLIHSVVPPGTGHGKPFKIVADRIGMTGPMRDAEPGPLLLKELQKIADDLGPLPHDKLHIGMNADGRGEPVVRKKKQTARQLKAYCEQDDCGYTVRVAAQWVNYLGPPCCPKHGAMTVEKPESKSAATQPQAAKQPAEDAPDDLAGYKSAADEYEAIAESEGV